MICYKDRSWCNPRTCAGKCPANRRFTDDEHVKAVQWWGSDDYPLAVEDFCGVCQ